MSSYLWDATSAASHLHVCCLAQPDDSDSNYESGEARNASTRRRDIDARVEDENFHTAEKPVYNRMIVKE